MDFVPGWLALPLFGSLFLGGTVFLIAMPRKNNPRETQFNLFGPRRTPDQIGKANAGFAAPLTHGELRRLGFALAGFALAWGAMVVIFVCLAITNYAVLGWANIVMAAWLLGASIIWGRLIQLWTGLLRRDQIATAKLLKLLKLP